MEWMHSALDMQQGSIQSCPAAVTVLYADLCHVSSAEESSAQSRCQPGTRPPCLGLACGWCDGVCSSHRALPCAALMGVPAAKPARGVRATAGSAQRGVGDCHFLQQQPRGCCTSTASPPQHRQSYPVPPVLPSTTSPPQHRQSWRFAAQTQRQLSRYQRCLGLALVPACPGTSSPASPGREQARIHVKHNIFIAKIGFFCSFHTQGFFPVHLRSKQVDRSSVRWADVRAALASDPPPRCWVAL